MDDTGGVDPAPLLDLDPGDRLMVGDDRQGLKGGPGELKPLSRPYRIDPPGKGGDGIELITTGDESDPIGAIGLLVEPVQFIDHRPHPLRGDLSDCGNSLKANRLRSGEEDRFDDLLLDRP